MDTVTRCFICGKRARWPVEAPTLCTAKCGAYRLLTLGEYVHGPAYRVEVIKYIQHQEALP